MADNVKEFEAGKETPADDTIEVSKSKVAEQLGKARDKFGHVADELEKQAKALGEGTSKVSHQVKESAGKASEVTKEKYGVAKEKVKYGYGKARKDLDTLTEDVNEYTRDNPGKAVLMAAGIGFVLGLLLRPRRHD